MESPISKKRKSPDREDPARTPTGTPARKRMRITQSQKQALVDNLQLESAFVRVHWFNAFVLMIAVTERARKLRAHYALQVQDLRARIERRVNRIPVALRKATMGELLEKHNATSRTAAGARDFKKPMPSKAIRNPALTISVDIGNRDSTSAITKSQNRRVKPPNDPGRFSDKENAPTAGNAYMPLDNPKKRNNPNATGAQSRAVSQVMRDAEIKILSPKSSNSRTFPQSPLLTSPGKPHSPGKPQQQLSVMSRPVTALKPSSPLKVMIENARARTAKDSSSDGSKSSPITTTRRVRATAQAKKATTRAAPAPVRPTTRQADRTASTSTASSNVSSGTTIIRSTRAAVASKNRGKTTAPSATKTRKTTARSQVATMAPTAKRLGGAGKNATGIDPPEAGGRVLRKRA
ncbi:hypothetical protein Egran_04244 [Elaphomyces granulatus]|uniref:Borealin N-terminal domain-containing protein n=1 Tax=Elaphomyces granulatus TaxID=519963 RepID=A0A232LV13_9EURO|nr:hypothetical protein Egran_04244 [Elaphomyces granulatus]